MGYLLKGIPRMRKKFTLHLCIYNHQMLEVNFNPFPQLETERLLLRRLIKKDDGQIFKMRSDAEVMKYIGKNPMQSVNEAVDWIQIVDTALDTNSGITWAIADKESPDTLIGTIGLWRFIKEHFRAEVGYMLLPVHWNKGLAKEALIKVIDYGFKDLKLHSIEGQITPRNEASASLLERTGFKREAYFKENYFVKGIFEDTAVYSLVSEL